MSKQEELSVQSMSSLGETIAVLTSENEYLSSLLKTFFTGDMPEKATLNHMILAKAGRLRLEEKARNAPKV